MTIVDVANQLSEQLGQHIQVHEDCIYLSGEQDDHVACLQIGANDGHLYFSAPVIKIATEDVSSECLQALLELNGDSKNYPEARIAFNPLTESAEWIERCDVDSNAQQLVALIQARGVLIGKLQQALATVNGA
jgi:hypothetical protein